MMNYACGFEQSETGKYFELIIVFTIILSLHSNERLWGISYSHSWKLCEQRHHWADVSCVKGNSLTAWSMLPCTNARFNILTHPIKGHSKFHGSGVGVGGSQYQKFQRRVHLGERRGGGKVHVYPNTFFDGGKWGHCLGTMKFTFLLKVSYHPLTRWESPFIFTRECSID